MKQKTLFLGLLFALVLSGLCAPTMFSQSLPAHYLTDFSLAGYKGDIPTPQRVIDITQPPFNADNTGVFDCAEIIQRAIDQTGNEGLIIYFPKGTYLIKHTLRLLSGTVLKGAGSDQTTLYFDITPPHENLIDIKGSLEESTFMLMADAYRNDKQVVLSSVSGLNVGATVLLRQDPGLFASRDAVREFYLQIFHIEEINGNTVTFKEPLRTDFRVSNEAFVQLMNPKKNVGIEDLKIICSQKVQVNGVPRNHNIAFLFADNCWVIGVESKWCNRSHIYISRSTNIQVSGNYFHRAHGYGGGGSAYGIYLTDGSGQILVANNIFDSLRHAMLTQVFASGNVFAYNYSSRVHRTDFTPHDRTGDLCVHGNRTHSNLFQGNIANYLVIDNPHGANGPRNIFLRNRLTTYGIIVEQQRNTEMGQRQRDAGIQNDSSVFIANEITHPAESGYGRFSIFPESRGNIRIGNVKQGENNITINPDGTDAEKFRSFFNQSKPLFWDIADSWYGIGTNTNATIPAEVRFHSDAIKTDSRKRIFDNVESMKNQ
jgi:hypothetical protein